MMKTAAAFALISTVALTGCSAFPSFGSLNLGSERGLFASADRTTLAPYNGYPGYADTRPLAARIENLTTERTPTGLILRAVVAVPAGGYRGVHIVENRNAPAGRIQLEARLQSGSTGTGATALATTFLSNAQLAGIGEVTLSSATNTLTIRP